jgi:predicted membrane-bound mannosyltransferase
MSARKTGLLGVILRYLDTLRFPYLLVATAALFLLDLVIPDVIPYADEILLGLLTLVLARLKRRRVEGSERSRLS